MRNSVTCRTLLCLLAVMAQAPPLVAQDSPGSTVSESPLLRHIFAPAAHPDVWPAGDWIPVDRDELLDALLPLEQTSDPESAFLEQAVYRARFDGESLRDGRLEATARLRGLRPRFMDLGSPNLAITNLSWGDGPAVWGLAADRRTLLRIDADQQQLTGHWSLAGRTAFSSVEFDLAVIPAVVSRVEVDVPVDHELTVSNGLVSQMSAGDDPDWRTWSIELGRRTSCRVTVAPTDAGEATSDRELVLSQISNYTFIGDGLRLQSDVTIQSVHGNFETIDFTVPPRMQFSPVTVGSETVLPSERLPDENASLLSVDVAGMELSRGTTFRLTGQLPVRSALTQTLPIIDVRGARWMRIRKHVDIARPLQLQDMATSGTLLVDATVGPDTGAALDFDDLNPASEITLSVDTPQPDLSAGVAALVDWTQSDPLLHETLQLTARSGSTYTLVCGVPSGWEVTHVAGDAATPVAQWQTVVEAENEPGQLQIELRKALTPQNPVGITIWARPLSLPLGDTFEVPVVPPVVTGERTCELLLLPPQGVQVRPASDSAYRAVDVESFLEDHPSIAERTTDRLDERTIALEAVDPPESQMLIVEREVDAEPLNSLAVSGNGAGDGGPSEDATRSNGGTTAGETPLMMPLTVSTLVAVDRGGLCRNRVTFAVPALRSSRMLTLRLPENATFLKCEGFSAQIGADREIVVTLPASRTSVGGRGFSITYESPLSRSVIAGEADIPLPSWDGGATTIGWEIRLPVGYRLRAPTTGSSARNDESLTWSQRLLGPLGRSSTAEWFWPFSARAWRELRSKGSEGDTPSPEQAVLTRSTVGGEPSLRLSFWDVSAARQVGWLVLLFTFLLCAWPFRETRLISPGWTLKLILLGSVAALLAPEFLAIPWGGFVVGAAWGALLPETWRRPNERPAVRPDSRPSTQVALPLAATAGIVLLGVLFEAAPCRAWQTRAVGEDAATRPPGQLDVLIPIGEDESAVSELPQVVYVEQTQAKALLGHRLTASPAYLLRSARYEVRDAEESPPSLLAQYEAVLLRPETETPVVIDLTGVLFADAQACRVNGEAAPLLPRRGRKGVVVMVPPIDAADEAARVVTASIELAIRPRPSGDESPWIDVGIPAIIDSQLTIPQSDAATPMTAVGRTGSAEVADSRWQYALGPVSFLSVQPEGSGIRRRWAVPLDAASVIEAYPLRLLVESRLTFAVEPRWSHLEPPTLLLQLPGHSIVRSVRANGLDQTRTQRAGDDGVEVLLTFQSIPDRELAVALSFDVALPNSGEESGTTIPALPFLDGRDAPGFPVHLLGVSAGRGLQLSAGDPEGMMPGTTGIDESRLPPWRGAGTSRTVEANYQLNSPRSLPIPLSVTTPEVGATIRQTVAVRPSVIDWSAEVDLTTRDASVISHRLNIDPRINVRSVRLLQDDVDRLASWSRTGPAELVLFLSEELSGTQSLRLSGALNVEDRQDFALPRLSMPSASLTTPAEVRVRRAEEVAIVLTSEEGTLVPGSPSGIVDDDGLVDVATVNMDETLPALRIRGRREDSVLDVEQVTIVNSIDEGIVDWSCHLHLGAAGMLPAEIEMQLTGDAQSVAIGASVPVHDAESQDRRRRWRLGPSTTAVDAIDVTISGQTPLAAGQLPEVQVDQGRLRRHVVLNLDHAVVEVAPDTAKTLSPGDVPQWLSEPHRTTAASGEVSELDESLVRLRSLADADAAVSLKRCDSAIWQRPGAEWSGVTIADVVAHTQSTITFSLPDGVVVRWASRDGNPLNDLDEQELSVELMMREKSQRITLWWTARTNKGQGVPLPRLVDLDGVEANVVVFGDQQRHYQFGRDAEDVGAGALLSRLMARNSASTASSPIITGLQDAGVVPASSLGKERGSAHVFGIRLPGNAGLVPVRQIDEQLLRIIRVIVAAGIALAVWFLIGRWVEHIRPDGRLAPGLLGMMLIAAIVWIAGASFVGFVLLTILSSAWLLTLRPGAPRVA